MMHLLSWRARHYLKLHRTNLESINETVEAGIAKGLSPDLALEIGVSAVQSVLEGLHGADAATLLGLLADEFEGRSVDLRRVHDTLRRFDVLR